MYRRTMPRSRAASSSFIDDRVQVKRVFPAGAHYYRTFALSAKAAGGLALLTLALLACNGGPVSPSDILDDLTESVETQNIVFHFSPGDSVDSAWQQAYHDWITDLLGVQLPTKLTYYKYTGRAQLESVTGRRTNGFAEADVQALHSVFAHDGHEAAHVYTARVGRPSNFFNEGIAVALNTEPGAVPWTSPWNGTHVYEHTQLLIRTNQLRPLGPLLENDAFRNAGEWVGYGEAGSFLLYLIEQRGIGPMLAFFSMSTSGASRARIEADIRAAWGQSLAELEAAWLTFIDGWSG